MTGNGVSDRGKRHSLGLSVRTLRHVAVQRAPVMSCTFETSCTRWSFLLTHSDDEPAQSSLLHVVGDMILEPTQIPAASIAMIGGTVALPSIKRLWPDVISYAFLFVRFLMYLRLSIFLR